MKAVLYFLIVLACLGVASASTSSEPTTGSATATAAPTGTVTGGTNPTVTGTAEPAVTTPNGAANIYCSVSVTMAVAAVVILKL